MRTVSHLYDSYQTATEVASALERAGFARDDISVIANQTAVPGGVPADPATTGLSPTMAPATTPVVEDATEPGTNAGTGASIGTLLGGGAGLLAGIGALAIPGVGPVVAAGWLVATLTGAGAGAGLGGLVGALTGSGVESERAHVYAESVRRGDTLVTVRVGSDITADAEKIMQEHHPIDADTRAAGYRADDGWTGFDETRGALTPEEMLAERERTTRTIL